MSPLCLGLPLHFFSTSPRLIDVRFGRRKGEQPVANEHAMRLQHATSPPLKALGRPGERGHPVDVPALHVAPPIPAYGVPASISVTVFFHQTTRSRCICALTPSNRAPLGLSAQPSSSSRRLSPAPPSRLPYHPSALLLFSFAQLVMQTVVCKFMHEGVRIAASCFQPGHRWLHA